MFFLQVRMYMLLGLMFGIVYALVSMLGYAMGVQSFTVYLLFSGVFIWIQYMIGPKIIEWTMQVRYVSETEYPELFRMVREMAQQARIPMPRIAVSASAVPNAFAFGRWLSDGRVCVTQGILRLLNREELRAVLGHELSHIKNRDVLTITLLSVIPIICYRIAFNMLFFGGRGNRRDGGNAVLFGLAALVFYFVANLLVLYASRIREFFADRGSVVLGNHPRHLATALYKLVYGSAAVSREQLRTVEGAKAFFVNDPSRARSELRELKQIDQDYNGVIDSEELRQIREKKIALSAGERFMELFSTHPNMLKRIQQLSQYVKS